MRENPIYHLCRKADWDAALRSGEYRGSADEIRAGFIHFSTAAQVVESAAKHRAGALDLLLLTVAAEGLGAGLRWEKSRGGQMFPHLYGPLKAAAVTRVDALALGPDGRHVFPKL